MKPTRWKNPANKLFRYQVGFTSPPHDFDGAPSDFLRMSPSNVGVHGRYGDIGVSGAGDTEVDNLG